MDLFKKSTVVGVSVTPEVGLEAAIIDIESKTIIKYGSKQLDYNSNLREIADLDLFKQELADLFLELEVPKNAQIVLNIPAPTFRINDYPAALEELQVSNAIEEELAQNVIFKNNNEPCASSIKLPTSTIQFNKVAYVAASRNMIYEVVLIIKDLGYRLLAIDTSVSSTLRSLIYLDRVNVDPTINWLLVLVENNSCRVISMTGANFIDAYEERISIGEVLGETENYSTVIDAVEPLLKNLPAKYMCVVSKTNVISAEVLANKINYSAPITYQEANGYSKEAFLQAAPDVDPDAANKITMDVIGACLYRDFVPSEFTRFNLFNRTLGEIYLMEQPPEFRIGDNLIILSNELLAKFFIFLCVFFVPIALITFIILKTSVSANNTTIEEYNTKIAKIDKFLEENKKISSEMFDEGTEIATGLAQNKAVYSYYTIVGTEIPKKLWLTHLKLGEKTTIEGQADNLESVYAFFRNIKDYNTDSEIKLQKLGLAAGSKNVLNNNSEFDTESLLTSLNADFYEFRISNEPEISKDDVKDGEKDGNNPSAPSLPSNLEPIKE